MSTPTPLNRLTLPLRKKNLIEASAGTGKTYTLSALYIRLVLGHGDTAFADGLKPENILTLTFTRAATHEMKDRIRGRLAKAARLFNDYAKANTDAERSIICKSCDDAFLQDLINDCTQPEEWARRCTTAAQQMDLASIYTINGFCQRALKRFAFAAGSTFEQELETDVPEMQRQIANDYWRRFILPLSKDLKAQLIKASIAAPDELQKKAYTYQKDAGYTAKAPSNSSLEALLKNAVSEVNRAEKTARDTLKKEWTDLQNWASKNKQLKPRQYGKSVWEHINTFIESGTYHTSLPRFSVRGIPWGNIPGELPPLKTFKCVEHYLELKDNDFFTPLWEHYINWTAAEEDERLNTQAKITFDSMVNNLADALNDEADQPSRPLANQLFKQWPCALIDEFQDTNAAQYDIFYHLFKDRDAASYCWLMIGDPKQSIYRFRGADIKVYLAAGQGTPTYNLDTNYRSSAASVQANNTLFTTSPLTYTQEGIFGYNAVRYYPVKHSGSTKKCLHNTQPQPGLTICYPNQEDIINVGAAKDFLAHQFANRIAQLLNQAHDGHLDFSDGENHTALQPEHIACLVRTNDEAKLLKSALSDHATDAVVLSDKSNIYSTDTAKDIFQLLNAIANPHDGGLVRGALACNLLAYEPDTLAHKVENDAAWQNTLRVFLELHNNWQHSGILATFHQLVQKLALAQRQHDERVLTDFFHLAELLQRAERELDGMEALISHLQIRINDAKEGNNDNKELLLRLENERNRVVIMTVHKAKGLEFPLVMLPFITLPGPEDPAPPEQNEAMRLLYVGLTRAKYACWIGLARVFNRSNKNGHHLHRTAIGRLLFNQHNISDTDIDKRLDQLVNNSQHTIAVDRDCLDDIQAQHHLQIPTLRSPDTTKPRSPQRWQTTSYSALVRHTHPAHDSAYAERALETLDEDEYDVAAEGIHAFPRGAHAGNKLHSLLEQLCNAPFSKATPEYIRALVDAQCQQAPWTEHTDVLCDWLHALITTPLEIDDARVSLTHMQATLAESEFWLKTEHVPLQTLDTLATQFMPGARAPLEAHQVNGMLKGFIDVLLNIDGRYYVLDYKSNYLGTTNAAYTQKAMQTAMLSHRYDLQSLIYQLALHRLLRQRLGKHYTPAQHLGGSVYFFLRGIHAPSQGVLVQPPNLTLLNRLDTLFEGGAS